MEERSEVSTMLQLMLQPAFRVEKGVVSHVNDAAAACFVKAGQPVDGLIAAGAEEYAEFSQGSLYLTLSLCGRQVGACVTRVENGDIFVLEQADELPQLQAMALAATALREPLTGLMSLADQMLPAMDKEDAALQTQAAQMNRRLYQMLRIVSNMSDAALYSQGQSAAMEYVQIGALLEEIFEKTATLAQAAGIRLEYELPGEAILTLADSDKLERAVYNMLSNAIKFASAGSTVMAKLTRKKERLYICVTNDHPGPQGNIYNRFLRQPALEDPRNGVGLGMVLVRAAAALHGGAVLTEHTAAGTRITMTIPLRHSSGSQVRSPILRIDYTGERDHSLTELADILPADCYSTDKVN